MSLAALFKVLFFLTKWIWNSYRVTCAKESAGTGDNKIIASAAFIHLTWPVRLLYNSVPVSVEECVHIRGRVCIYSRVCVCVRGRASSGLSNLPDGPFKLKWASITLMGKTTRTMILFLPPVSRKWGLPQSLSAPITSTFIIIIIILAPRPICWHSLITNLTSSLSRCSLPLHLHSSAAPPHTAHHWDTILERTLYVSKQTYHVSVSLLVHSFLIKGALLLHLAVFHTSIPMSGQSILTAMKYYMHWAFGSGHLTPTRFI